MGGDGTWDLIVRYPERFTAAVPVGSFGTYGYLYDVDESGELLTFIVPEHLLNFPIYVVYDLDDDIRPALYSQQQYDAFIAAGATNILRRETTGHGHDICVRYVTRFDISLMEWLFSQVKEG